MTGSEKLSMLKSNLEISNSLRDTYLAQLIASAEREIAREGIELFDTIDDNNLVIMYAAYLYRNRMEAEVAMPRMLRYALNNRILSQKMAGDLS